MPERAWVYSNQLGLRYNALGLQNTLFAGYQARLYNKPQDDLLFGRAYIMGGLFSRVNPQAAHTGLFVRALPIAVLELQGIVSYVSGIAKAEDLPSYYTQGTKDAVASTASPQAPFGSLIESGLHASFQARLQAKVGHVALRSTNLFQYLNLGSGGDSAGEGLFYHQGLDLVTAQQSWVYQNDTDLLYANSNKPWVLGGRYTYAAPISTTPQALLDQEALYSSHRAGLLFAWKFSAPRTAAGLEASNRHALIVLSQWYLSHAFRAGQSMNQAVPCVTVAYALNGRLGE